MSKDVESVRERFIRDLEKELVYFANRQRKKLSKVEVATIAERVMEKVDLDNAVFKHKGTTWLARMIVDNVPAPPTDIKS